jgi:hypothetical protein
MNGGHVRPSVDSVVLCDEAQERPDGGWDLLGVRTFLQAPALFPYLHPRLCVFLRVYGPRGDVSLGVSVRRHGVRPPIRETSGHRIELFGPDLFVSVCVRLEDVEFPASGVYWVEAKIDRRPVARHRLEVE